MDMCCHTHTVYDSVCPQLAELHKQYEKLCEERNALELELQAQYGMLLESVM
jgi:hypothetical protein